MLRVSRPPTAEFSAKFRKLSMLNSTDQSWLSNGLVAAEAVGSKDKMAMLFTARDFACPTCGAKPEEACKMNNGGSRFQSHSERYYVAQDHQVQISFDNPTPFKKPVRAVMEDSLEAQRFSS